MVMTSCICVPPMIDDDSLTTDDVPSQVICAGEAGRRARARALDRSDGGVGSAAMEIIRKDVVVVGLGAFGSAGLWRLAHRGMDVAGVERHGIGHHLGSSHGVTRLFRIACQEHPGLPPIALKSLELWTR